METIAAYGPYQSESLFLLIGRNPWPNYVSAKLLLASGGQLYLVHSRGTEESAKRLAEYWVTCEREPRPILVSVSEKDGHRIKNEVAIRMAGIRQGRIGLNYTGGTKVMAVHACQAARDLRDSRSSTIVLSYLDARSNRLIFDDLVVPSAQTESLLFRLTPKLEDVVALHAFRLVHEIEREVRERELAAALLKIHCATDGVRAWREWCDKELRPGTRDRKTGTWMKEQPLSQVHMPLPTDPTLATFVDLFRQRFQIDGPTFSLQHISNQAGFRKIKHLCEWLDGKWLEYHVLATLDDIHTHAGDRLFHDYGLGIKPEMDRERGEFDVDIGVMQGYQLYAISCTTDQDPGMCKLKLFEAYVRAQNLGGDEALIGLVCTTERPENLERNLSRSWDAAYRIRVFGQSHLGELQRHLTEWLETRGAERSDE